MIKNDFFSFGKCFSKMFFSQENCLKALLTSFPLHLTFLQLLWFRDDFFFFFFFFFKFKGLVAISRGFIQSFQIQVTVSQARHSWVKLGSASVLQVTADTRYSRHQLRIAAGSQGHLFFVPYRTH